MKEEQEPIIITLTGDLGSGKSSLSKRLCSLLGADYYSTGSAQRKIAEEMGITTLELNHLADKDSSIDDKIDSVFANLSETKKNLIVDSRMAWHFIPKSIKIRLKVDPIKAAERVMNDDDRKSEAYQTTEQALEMIEKRKNSEQQRFLSYYKVDICDDNNYDLVIDTSDKSRDDVYDDVRSYLKM